MEFSISKASIIEGEQPCDNVTKVIVNKNKYTDEEYRININTLEELLSLVDAEGDIIISKAMSWENGEHKFHRPSLLIYDSHIE